MVTSAEYVVVKVQLINPSSIPAFVLVASNIYTKTGKLRLSLNFIETFCAKLQNVTALLSAYSGYLQFCCSLRSLISIPSFFRQASMVYSLFSFCSLVQWLKYSKKEFCELCKHKFSFTPSEYIKELHCGV